MPTNSRFNLLETAGNITFTAIPNNFLDSVAPTLNPSELRVMLYIYRHTLGFQKLTDTISYDQFLHGMVTHNRRCLDKGAGVSRNSLVAALSSLENKALIKRQHSGKYGPVTIKLQPAALYDPIEANPEKPSGTPGQPARTARKKTALATEDATNAEAGETANYAATGQIKAQKLDLLEGPEKPARCNQAQVLKEPANCKTQNLDHTKETKIQKQNKPSRVAVAQIAQASKLIETNVPGISAGDATRLAGQALANGRDRDYISRLVHHVTGNPAIRVPAAVLTTLIKANEDRLPQAQNPVRLDSSNQSPTKKFATGKNLKTGRPPVGKGIDFGKYANLSVTLPGAARLAQLDPAASALPLSSETTPEPGRQMDPRLKYSLQEFDSRLAIYVRHLAVEDNLLKVGFFGAKRIPEGELAAWLPLVKIYYPEVTAIKVMDQTLYN